MNMISIQDEEDLDLVAQDCQLFEMRVDPSFCEQVDNNAKQYFVKSTHLL